MNRNQVATDTLTIPEVARRLGIGRSLAYDLARRNQIPGVIRLGRRLLVKRAALDQWLATDSPTDAARGNS
jgi:excisionase family DNA binding protein